MSVLCFLTKSNIHFIDEGELEDLSKENIEADCFMLTFYKATTSKHPSNFQHKSLKDSVLLEIVE